jgi:cell division protein FtsL
MQAQRELEEEARRLRLERSLLRSPDRVEKLAREKLGMIRPDPVRIRVVRTATEVAAAP